MPLTFMLQVNTLKEIARMNTATTEIPTLRVPSWNIDKLKKTVNKINKRASKYNFAPINYEITGTEFVKINREDEHSIEVNIINFSIELPKIEGWTFVGTLDHISIPGKVIVKSAPGKQIPKEFFNSPPVCDHCETHRRRNETFLLTKNGEYKRVGRSCVKDFIGYDPTAVLGYLENVVQFIESFDDQDTWFDGGGLQYYTIDADAILRATNALVNRVGFVSRSKADLENGSMATADLIINYFFPPSVQYNAELQRSEWVQALSTEKEINQQAVDNARAWLAEQNAEDNEYLTNLKNLAEVKEIPTRMFGYWCSLIATYNRAVEQERQRKASNENRTNEHTGTLKKRQEFILTLDNVIITEGYYGYTYIHKFVDQDGRALTWFASNKSDMEKGNTYHVKATPKKHDEYKGTKITVINRVTIV